MTRMEAEKRAMTLNASGKDARPMALPWDINFWVVRIYKNGKPDDCIYYA